MRHPTDRWGPLLTGIALTLAFAGPASSEETRRDRIDNELTTITKFTINARAKLINGVVGRPSEGASMGRQGPVQNCCSVNLERINESISVVRRIIGELETCYIESANEGAIAMSSVFGADLASFSRGVDGFGNSGSPREAMNHLGAITRLFNVMSDSIKAVEDCPAVAPEASQDGDADKGADTDKKKRKQQQKKKKKESGANDSASW